MHLDEAVKLVAWLKEALEEKVPILSFRYDLVFRDAFFKDSFRKNIPREGAVEKSGVYLIMDRDNNILYIGKATSNNLGAEIYSKFSAASRIIDQVRDIPVFEKRQPRKIRPRQFKTTNHPTYTIQ